jgi:hypothetical protein
MDYVTSTAVTPAETPDGLTPVSEGAFTSAAPPGGLEDRVGPQIPGVEALEEDLIADSRASLTPAQMVERKLVFLLKSNPLPVSHLMTSSRTIRHR